MAGAVRGCGCAYTTHGRVSVRVSRSRAYTTHGRVRVRVSRSRGCRPPRALPPEPREEEPQPQDADTAAAAEDWRAFRARLAGAAAEADAPRETANRALLREQNPRLAAEPWWAHAAGAPERGGVLLRAPLHVQMLSTPVVGDSLRKALRDDVMTQLGAEDAAAVEDRVQEWSKVDSWYCAEFSEAFAAQAAYRIGEAIDRGDNVSDLDPADVEILRALESHQSAWQEVVLLVDHADADEDGRGGGSRGIVLNRPLRLTVGDLERRLPSSVAAELQENDALEVFGDEVVYYGGPGATMCVLHAYDLPGSRELVPGIFTGGLGEAAEMVRAGEMRPDECRFFFGEREWAAGTLASECVCGSWWPGAASRPLLLKHCLGLPRPLWHELADLFGSDFERVSTRELSKRTDLA